MNEGGQLFSSAGHILTLELSSTYQILAKRSIQSPELTLAVLIITSCTSSLGIVDDRFLDQFRKKVANQCFNSYTLLAFIDIILNYL